MSIRIALARRISGACKAWVVGLAHMPELLGGSIDTPEFVARFVAWNEDTTIVPTVNPRDAIIELEEACLNSPAALILDLDGSLSALIVIFQ
jgi:hypothetical protein